MSLNVLVQNIDDWCGTPVPDQPPRPTWLRESRTAVVLTEMSTDLTGESQRDPLWEAARDLDRLVSETVALNPRPLPPLREPNA